MAMTKAVSFQVRLEPELFQEIKKRASSRKISTNKLFVEAVSDYLKDERDREWRAGFEAMGRDPEVCDVDYMLPAAREVVLGESH